MLLRNETVPNTALAQSLQYQEPSSRDTHHSGQKTMKMKEALSVIVLARIVMPTRPKRSQLRTSR